VLAGAAGGPKWLVLHGLDNYIFSDLLSSVQKPVDLIGSSIGAWRYTKYCHGDFQTAFKQFDDIYFGQTYLENATLKDVSDEIERMLNVLFPEGCEQEILANPKFRINIFADASRGIIKSDNPWVIGPTLLLATVANMLHRKAIQWFFKRYLFHHPAAVPPLHPFQDYPTNLDALTTANLKSAVMASGAIPMVVNGVNMPGINNTNFRDGGLIDYHLTLDYKMNDGLILMPHFSPKVITNWLDKYVPWREPILTGWDRVVLVTPSEEFIDALPLQKIPDRSDFKRFKSDDNARNSYWREVTNRSELMAEELQRLIEQQDIASVIEPLENL